MAASRQSWRKRLALMVYRPLRPFLRPLAWRLRSFLVAAVREDAAAMRDHIARVQGELGVLRTELAALRPVSAELPAMRMVLESLAGEIAALRGEVGVLRGELAARPDSVPVTEVAALARSAEAALLTLATARLG